MLKRMGLLLLISLLLAMGLYHMRPMFQADYVVDPTAKLDPLDHYTVTAWIAHPIIEASPAYRQAITQVFADFTALHGNITVETVFIPDHLFQERLAQELASGTPPDIALDTENAPIHYGELQLPLGRYLAPADKANYSSSALGQASYRGALLGLPVGLSSRLFLANVGILQTAGMPLDNIVQQGWSWEQFTQTMAASTSKAIQGYVPTNVSTPLLQSIAASVGAPWPWDHQGNLVWREQTLLAIATLWHQLASMGGRTELSAATESALALFLNGKAALIGPLNPQLTTWLYHEARERQMTLAVLPVPSGQATPFADLRAVNLVAFRQRAQTRSDHARIVAELAIAELAKFAAPRLSLVLREHLSLIPSQASFSPIDDASWQRDSIAATNTAFAPSVPYILGKKGGENLVPWEEVLLPLWMSLVQGDLTPEEFARRAHSALAELSP